jgi:hypothetical protein
MAIVATTKVCKKCKAEKTIERFLVRRGRPNNQRRSCCDDCINIAQRVRYDRIKRERANRVVTMDGTKTCCRCKEVKHVTSFYVARAELDGRRKHCAQCCRELTQIENINRPELYAAIRRRSNLKRSFGITVEEYEALLVSQKGGCAICGRTNEQEVARSGRRMPVDHCHQTGRIRGILCGNCNKGLGKFKDDPTRLYAAIDYLNTRSLEKKESA